MTQQQPVGRRAVAAVKGSSRSAVPVLVLLAVMWVSETFDQLTGGRLDANGIQPRTESGLAGVLFAPFLHAGFGHLVANTTAFLVLGLLIAWTTRHFWAATLGIVLLGGLGTWLIAPPYTVHIGASGLVYGYAAFLVAWGVFARRLLNVAVGIVVVVLYGGIAWGVLPGQPGISWQGHLCGAIAGVLMAWFLSRDVRRTRYRAV